MTQLIIGLVGPIASGKSTVAAYLRDNYGAAVFNFSQPLRDILTRLHLEVNRANLANLSENLRGLFGQDLISRTLEADLQASQTPLIVLDGVRRLPDIERIKQLPNFVLVGVVAKERQRHQRLIGRGQNADDRTKTFEQFLADEQAGADRDIPQVLALAKQIIDNNGSLDSTCKQIDKLISKFLK